MSISAGATKHGFAAGSGKKNGVEIMYDNDMYGNDGYRPPAHSSPLARVSLVLSIVSLMTCMVIYISLPCGALAVIFALLSRTDTIKSRKYRASVICGICGMVLTSVLTWSAFYKVFTDPEMFDAIEYYMQMYTGDPELDLREELGEILPFVPEESGKKKADDPQQSPADPFTDAPGMNRMPDVVQDIPDNGGGFI